jgi:ketosteroid isomerase-like protein
MTRIVHFAATIFAVAAIMVGAAENPSPEQMLAAADVLDEQYIAALNKSDLNALMALYPKSPDIVSFAPDGAQLHGWQAIRDYYAGAMAKTPGAKYEFTGRHNKAVGSLVLGWGTFRGTVATDKGPPSVIEGRYTDVKAHTGGKWGYIMEHGSLLFPAPPAGPARQ